MTVQYAPDKNKVCCTVLHVEVNGQIDVGQPKNWYWCKYIWNEQVTKSGKKWFNAQQKTFNFEEMRKVVDFDHWTKWTEWDGTSVEKYHKTKNSC